MWWVEDGATGVAVPTRKFVGMTSWNFHTKEVKGPIILWTSKCLFLPWACLATTMNIGLGLESCKSVAYLLTSIGYSKMVQIQTQRHHHQQTHQHNRMGAIADRNCIQLLMFLWVYHMSCICYFVQVLRSMKQIIIHNFTRSVGSTTGVVASIMVTPEFKQTAY